MRSELLVLGLSTMLVGCAHPYGDDEPTAATESHELPVRKAEADATDEPKDTTKQTVEPTEPSKSVATTEKTGPEPTAAPSGTTFDFSWRQASETARYSFDVFLKDGTWIGPCVSTEYLGKKLQLTFDGRCPSSVPHPKVAIEEIDDFMLCSAENNDWQHPICTHANWDGVSSEITFEN